MDSIDAFLREVSGSLPDAPFIKVPGTDMALQRTLMCSACGLHLATVDFAMQIPASGRAAVIYRYAEMLRKQLPCCPSCREVFGPAPLV